MIVKNKCVCLSKGEKNGICRHPKKSIRGICPLQRDKSVEEKLGLISARPNLNMGSAELDENGLLLDHAVSYHPNEKFECACPTVSKIRRDYAIPREYCYCCGGHFRYCVSRGYLSFE